MGIRQLRLSTTFLRIRRVADSTFPCTSNSVKIFTNYVTERECSLQSGSAVTFRNTCKLERLEFRDVHRRCRAKSVKR